MKMFRFCFCLFLSGCLLLVPLISTTAFGVVNSSSAFSTATDVTPFYKLLPGIGDVNMDECVDARDALMVLKYAVGKIELDETQQIVADFSYHYYKTEFHLGIDAKDALIILQCASSSGPFKVKL